MIPICSANSTCRKVPLADLVSIRPQPDLILQMIVNHQWATHLGDIKEAFLEADVREKALANPVFAELPPGGVPGVEPRCWETSTGRMTLLMNGIVSSIGLPASGFVKSKFDNCLYLCFGSNGNLEGVLGAHASTTPLLEVQVLVMKLQLTP